MNVDFRETQRKRNFAPNQVSCASLRIGGKVGIALRCAGLRVSEELTDHMEGKTLSRTYSGRCVSQIVQPHPFKPGP